MGLKKWNGTQWVSASPSIQVTTDTVTNSSQVSGQTLTSALNDLNNRVPSSGTNNYYLKKTSEGNIWAEVQGGSSNFAVFECRMTSTAPTITGVTYSDINSAYTAGKAIMLKMTSVPGTRVSYYGLVSYSSNKFDFQVLGLNEPDTADCSGAIIQLSVTNTDTWTMNLFALGSSLSSESTEYEVPSSKEVYDTFVGVSSAIDGKISMPSGGSTGNVLTKTSDGVAWSSGGSGGGTITEIRMNGQSKGTSGVVDLGTVITAHQDISGKLNIPACITSGTSIILADNTEYRLSNVTTLNVAYPADYFNSWMEISTAQSTAATISISFPSNTKYIGDAPEFESAQEWHISIKNGVMVAGLVGDGT